MKQKLLVLAIGNDAIANIKVELDIRGEDYVMEPISTKSPRLDEIKFFVDEKDHSRLTQELQAVLSH